MCKKKWIDGVVASSNAEFLPDNVFIDGFISDGYFVISELLGYNMGEFHIGKKCKDGMSKDLNR